MLEAIRKTNPNTDYMYVVDTRPRVSSIRIYIKKKYSIFVATNFHIFFCPSTTCPTLLACNSDKCHGESSSWQGLWEWGFLWKHQISLFGDWKHSCTAHKPTETNWGLWAKIAHNECFFECSGVVGLAEEYTFYFGYIQVS